MYDVKEVRAELARRGLTSRKICLKAGMNERTFYRKINSGKLSLEETKAISKAAGFDPDTATRLFLL